MTNNSSDNNIIIQGRYKYERFEIELPFESLDAAMWVFLYPMHKLEPQRFCITCDAIIRRYSNQGTNYKTRLNILVYKSRLSLYPMTGSNHINYHSIKMGLEKVRKIFSQYHRRPQELSEVTEQDTSDEKE